MNMYVKDCPKLAEKILFMKKIPSDKLLIPKISKDFLDMLHSNGIEQCDALQVAFEEALTNAILHGNKNNHNKNIYLSINIDNEKIEIIIEDEGEGFDYFTAMINLTESQENIYKDSGRGIFLISLYTDDFYFEDNGRKIVMIKYRN
ncbi:ATP-binding protein [Brachyspira murdochii]|uniref:Anti-sigma factor n=2 Tax=Brachyspira murdochii TaxID=84378 RepID=A0ABX5B6B6_9SPIR|nr:ATP-binding protein [Brachyspira murdochii]ADG71062.1 putative anti-sigma regulatory factor, serine/threonine protein kinase [Brachyspira murdochii DSM 12563]PPS22344.1 anti-sigma factor [Brachyspira murdochii]